MLKERMLTNNMASVEEFKVNTQTVLKASDTQISQAVLFSLKFHLDIFIYNIYMNNTNLQSTRKIFPFFHILT